MSKSKKKVRKVGDLTIRATARGLARLVRLLKPGLVSASGFWEAERNGCNGRGCDHGKG